MTAPTIFNDRYLRQLPEDQFRSLLDFFLGSCSMGLDISKLIVEMHKIEKMKYGTRQE